MAERPGGAERCVPIVACRRVAVAFAIVLAALPARSIVTASGRNVPQPPGLELAAVGLLSNGCSTVLLKGGGWLLGSGHCAAGPGSTVSFGNGATAAITELHLAPGWNPVQQVGVNDLSLMRLAAPPRGIAGMRIASRPLLGATVVVAGYGGGGSGESGESLARGTLRFGLNQYELLLADTATAVYAGRVMAFDFDDGSAAKNQFGSVGLGAAEAMLASLDSGGPTFVREGGVWKIAGIHTGIAVGHGSAFGGVGFDIQPAYYGPWIRSLTTAP